MTHALTMLYTYVTLHFWRDVWLLNLPEPGRSCCCASTRFRQEGLRPSVGTRVAYLAMFSNTNYCQHQHYPERPAHPEQVLTLRQRGEESEGLARELQETRREAEEHKAQREEVPSNHRTGTPP